MESYLTSAYVSSSGALSRNVHQNSGFCPTPISAVINLVHASEWLSTNYVTLGQLLWVRGGALDSEDGGCRLTSIEWYTSTHICGHLW